MLVLLFLVVPLFLSNGLPAAAETVTVVGTQGAAGAPGMAGNPPTPGSPGADGESVTGTADAPYEDNTADVRGGHGGAGGDGGDATSGAGAAGGHGGAGGDAIAIATTFGASVVNATATGGQPGLGGRGGDGASYPIPAPPDGDEGLRGRSGDASAYATIENAYGADDAAPGLDGLAYAHTYGSTTTESGDVFATITGEATGEGPADRVHNLTAKALASSSLEINGDARAEATGATTHGVLNVEAIATGGHAGSIDPRTGTAAAIATGTHSGEGELNVHASVSGNSGLGELADIRASGIATGGADVSVRADIDAGPIVEVRDAVSGSTSGLLQLQQYVDAGGFDISSPEIGARTSLVAENAGGGDLDISMTAISTQDGPISAPRSLVVTTVGDVIGTSETGANVDINVTAIGEEIRMVDLDDSSRRSRIAGISNGGDVSVTADFRAGGLALSTLDGTTLIGDPGRSLVMENAAEGSTTGNLELIQYGTGGDGGDGRSILQQPPHFAAVGGDGGDVVNRLSRSGSFESLLLEGRSRAGRGGDGESSEEGSRAGVGGEATLSLDATNSSGRAEVRGYALGGTGGSGDLRGANGGDAIVDFDANTLGDGQAVVVGYDPSVRGPKGARAGSGGFAIYYSAPTDSWRAGDGGRAESHSNGRAYGDSTVDVYDYAIGGAGGVDTRSFSSPIALPGGEGGDASSTAIGVGGGSARVLASSSATGGSGSHDIYRPGGYQGSGGSAEAYSRAEGLGEVQALSSAIGGGAGGTTAHAGSAHALSEALGDSGMARAEAATGAGTNASFRALVSREIRSNASIEATATYGMALPAQPTTRDGQAFITGSPLADDVAAAVEAHVGLANVISEVPGARVEALGDWSARSGGPDTSTQSVELDITLAPPENPGNLMLAVFDLDASGGGFDELTFRLEVLGQSFGQEQVFTSLAEADDYFASLIDLGEAFVDGFRNGNDPGVRAIFEWSGHQEQDVAFGLAAVVVPEPSTALLLGLGLGVLRAIRPGRPR